MTFSLSIHNALRTFLLIVAGSLSFQFYGQTLREINIEIAQDSIDELESHPFTNEDVHGNFISDDLRFSDIEIHYRGAYYLNTLLRKFKQRNWKIKMPKSDRYLNRREWNFNFEQHVRQKFAYHLMEKAGVKVVSTEHVKLSVNGDYHGLYLKYEDPDNKRWLTDAFGSNKGDLYKAAYDMPDKTKYFADLTDLGSNSEDYFLHYRKQTNNNDEEEFNYQSIMDFVKMINTTPENVFDEAIKMYFDVEEFLNYLIISNFISNWDSYPQRPKNFWLYNNPTDSLWHYIPWDMDGTFQRDGWLNSFGIDASVLHYLDHYEEFPLVSNETKERPLVWRIMDVEVFRNLYLRKYQDAITGFLSEASLFHDLDSIKSLINQNISGNEEDKFNQSVSETKSYIRDKLVNVSTELKQYDFTPVSNVNVKASAAVFPAIASTHFFIRMSEVQNLTAIRVFDQAGRQVLELSPKIKLHEMQSFRVQLPQVPEGLYHVLIETNTNQFRQKLIVR